MRRESPAVSPTSGGITQPQIKVSTPSASLVVMDTELPDFGLPEFGKLVGGSPGRDPDDLFRLFLLRSQLLMEQERKRADVDRLSHTPPGP